MKLKITQLKAPWPAGARVGDIVEMEHMPAWATGKCERVADDMSATVEGSGGNPGPAADPLQQLREEADAAFTRLRAEHASMVEAMTREHSLAVAKITQELADMQALKEAGEKAHAETSAQLAKVTQELAEATKTLQHARSGRK